MRCALRFPVKLMQCDEEAWAPDVPPENWLKLSPFTNTSRPFRVGLHTLVRRQLPPGTNISGTVHSYVLDRVTKNK